MSQKARLLELVDAFIEGKDQSMRLVNEIEGILVDHYLETSVFEELTEPLALYRPGCGAPYYGVAEMADTLREAREAINDLE
ncbi:hypothetical protein G3260_004431 [Streptomyces albus]|uniref:Uncharacterized protein n=3 Tax=Streptomyces albus TaxID=1888 RepID=A0A6C1C6D8_9ACTN|nr:MULTISPECIES: hypothetical protein [Streptomyces]QID37899.1 hypothetical protein G3260_004431 [Streptomyces albus]TGG75674.1 hypothetical protein D8771_32245 [Streptomyces albus]UVN55131.1 hypothetical protein NR995_11820 [Streptomyces albus]